MKFGKITAAVFMATVAVGVTAATANGQPAVAVEQPAVVAQGNATTGVVNGIGYHTTVSGIDKAITTTLDNGSFALASDGATVLLKSADGATVDQVRLPTEFAGRPVAVATQISDNSRVLTLTPSMAAADVAELQGKDISELRDISSIDRLIEQVNKNLPGVVIGGVLGAFVPFLFFITIPVGMVVGGYIMGGQEFLDAVIAAATGQP